MGNSVTIQRPDGQSFAGYLAEPSAAPGAPGVVVIQEWWGLNDQIKGVADRLARAGYRALVPDLYRGQLALAENEASHLMNQLNFADAAGQDVRGAVQWLKASGSTHVGVTGFCMGGALTLLAAANVPELHAAVAWYGCPPLEYLAVAQIKIPLMGHFGLRDTVFPIQQIDTLEQRLLASGVAFEFQRYDCKHAFANETADAKHLPYLKYDAAAAELAWQRTLGFLQEHLH